VIAMKKPATNWTDEDVRAYLDSTGEQADEWCVSELGVYGLIRADGQLLACADDDEERSRRVVEYLLKTEARRF
jgi:hypothetical protein